MITIGNDGHRLVSTNFWETEYATRGLLYLSINAGRFRLLVPRLQESMLKEMATAREVILTRGTFNGKAEAVEVLFDDGSKEPFAIFLDPVQLDRRWTPDDEKSACFFAVYTETIVETLTFSRCRLRRTATLPCLKPWRD